MLWGTGIMSKTVYQIFPHVSIGYIIAPILQLSQYPYSLSFDFSTLSLELDPVTYLASVI